MTETGIALVATIGSIIIMLGGGWLVFARLKDTGQGFDPNSLKALGIVLFIPTLVVMGAAVADFQSETLAALLGTVAGYVLSQATKDTETKDSE